MANHLRQLQSMWALEEAAPCYTYEEIMKEARAKGISDLPYEDEMAEIIKQLSDEPTFEEKTVELMQTNEDVFVKRLRHRGLGEGMEQVYYIDSLFRVYGVKVLEQHLVNLKKQSRLVTKLLEKYRGN